MAHVTARFPAAPRSVDPDSRDQGALPMAPFTALRYTTGYARTIDRGPYGLEAFFCRWNRLMYRGVMAATTAFSAGTGYFAGTAINQYRNKDAQWGGSAIAATGFAALTGQGFFFGYHFRRLYLESAATFDGQCPKLPSYGEPGFDWRQNEISRFFFTASPNPVVPGLRVVAQTIVDDVWPTKEQRPGDPAVPVHAPVDPATLPKVLHGGGPLPKAEVIHPPRRRGAIPINDGTAPLPPKAALGENGDMFAVEKVDSAFGLASVDSCLGAAVLMRGCTPQRLTVSPTLWLTGPAHEDLAKFAVGVMGVAAAGAGAWVYLGRTGVAAAAASL